MNDDKRPNETAPATLDAVVQLFAYVASLAWAQSPEAALYAAGLASEGLAIQLIQRQPERREAVLGALRGMVAAVDAMTGPKH